ncbi:very long chain fatty acid elongase 7-like [Musca autumnalis]|uniref:very long chain fatty acid elongase 7-like n=1 Tax=Musca autumnalis TaxID=221902 RepID=UPI003CF91C8A
MEFLGLFYQNIQSALSTLQIDKRITTNPMLGSPMFMVLIFATYLFIVRKWGPKFMEDRKPFKVEGLMKLYNVMQIILNAFIFYEAVRYSYWRSDFSFKCQAHDPTDMSLETIKGTRPAYLYYLTKYLDLFDTIFFLLRKKYNQISFLHVYHHALMILGTHLYVSKAFGSHLTLIGVINSFIHVVMYTYYLAAAMKINIDLKPWKKTMTTMQLIQFVVLLIHQSLPLIDNSCNLNKWLVLLSTTQCVFMIILFGNFYYHSYIRTDKKKKLT